MQEIYIKLEDDFLNIDNLLQKIPSSSKSEIIFSYISDFKSAKLLRDCVSKICKILGINSTRTSRLVLIIDELNNNAIEYGSKTGEINYMTFNINNSDENIELIVEVKDSGNGHNHKSAKQMEELRKTKLKMGFKNHNSIRGRGLFLIIDNMVDKLYFKDSSVGGLIVGIKKTIQK